MSETKGQSGKLALQSHEQRPLTHAIGRMQRLGPREVLFNFIICFSLNYCVDTNRRNLHYLAHPLFSVWLVTKPPNC